jgi:Zn-dependent protease with chaperone function/Flp pilus assembly protein TadD
MRRYRLAALCAGLLLVVAAGRVWAQAGGPPNGADPAGYSRDSTEEQAILDRLAAINPQAVPLFQSATTAMDAGDNAAARDEFRQVLELAPDFPDALRRLSYVLDALDDREGAVTTAQRAVELEPNPWNETALARALLTRDATGDQTAALQQVQAALAQAPDDVEALLILGYAALMNGDAAAVHQADVSLQQLAPNEPLTHFLHGFVLAEAGQWEAAERELRVSGQLGLPPEMVTSALNTGIAGQATVQRWTRRGGFALTGWLGGLLALFASGMVLSSLTLRAIEQPRASGSEQISPAERALRTIYRGVIGLTAFYFYFSLPMLAVLILAIGAALGYAFLYAGQLPLGFTLSLLVAGGYTLIAILRSLFVRVNDGEPGRRLQRAEAPELWALLEAVAKHLKTNPVQAVYITPGVEVAVAERGGQWARLRGQTERALILGLGALPGLTRGQLRAILAHEYGHFSNRDTAGGALARRVRTATYELALGLARGRQAHWYNPVWLFANGFHRLFLRITLGASRLQEVLADRYAVRAYGVRDFSEGLSHIVRQALVFDAVVKQEIELASTQQRSLNNLYTRPQMPRLYEASAIQKRHQEVLARPTSPYDSHPAVQVRLRLVQQAGAPLTVAEDSRPAGDLLRNAEALQEAMTTIVQGQLRNRPMIPRVREMVTANR